MNQTGALYGLLYFPLAKKMRIHMEVLHMLILIALCIALAGVIIFGMSLIPILIIVAKYIALGCAGYWLYKKLFKKNKKDND